MNLRHRHDPAGIAGVHQIARIDLPQTHDALDRRRDVTKAQVQLCRFHRRVVPRDRRKQMIYQRLLGVDLLTRCKIPLRQRAVARQVLPGVDKVRLVLAFLRRRRVERGLERPRIDHRQHVALLHLLPLGRRHLVQGAVNACPHQNRIERLHRSEAR